MILSRENCLRFGVLLLAVAVALAGCSSIGEANRAIESVRPAADDAALPRACEKLDFRGSSLPQLVAFAVTNHPSAAAAACEVQDARLQLRQLAADAPVICMTHEHLLDAVSLSLSGGYDASSSVAEHADDLRFKTEGNAHAALSLELLVYDFGRHDAQMRAQVERVLASELRLAETCHEIFRSVASAYFELLKQGALEVVARTNEAMYAAHLEQAERLFENGEAQKLDVLRARLDYAQSKEATVAAVNAVRNAGAGLVNALGVSVDRFSCENASDFATNALEVAIRGLGDSDWTAESAFAFARTNAPAVRIARAQLRAAIQDVEYAKSDLLPRISAGASVGWTDPHRWLWNWTVGGVFSLFEGFRKTTALDRAVVALRKAEVEVEDCEQQLSLGLQQAIVRRDNARESVRTAQDSLERAAENLELVDEQFRVGEADRVEFTDAVADYVTAMGNRVRAFYDGQQAEASLRSLAGAEPVYAERRLTEGKKR